ncbi:MAG: methyltransferase domain-containing protein [Lachnospiraceae bacterium]|nr:methyltransferase domain-containing protein [Lachnospiraceae bacterium]
MGNIKIGKVNIDLMHYSGKDIYSEGEIEDKLLKVAEEKDPKDFRKIIEDSESWSYLYHLSKERENIVSWLPISKSDKVLDVGAGPGAIAGELCKLALSVDCIDLSLKRSKINASRNKECSNLSIKVGNFTDIEPDLDNDYDWIMLIGVFEYAISYIGSETPFEDFLKILKKHLKKDGRIVIAIENRLGLKYFAGSKEDHTCEFFDGIENYKTDSHVRTFTKKGLEKIFKKVNITNYHFYYPYPDYKLPNAIYSDKRLPSCGELKDNIRNFDQDRLMLFDETKAFDGIIDDGMFDEFSNSFEVILGPDVNVSYAKYSMDRDDAYCIKTKIFEENGVKKVEKACVYEAGKTHIANIKKAMEELRKRYFGSDLDVNEILSYDEKEGRLVFEYIEGKTLDVLIDECILNNNKEGFEKLFETYKFFISFNEEYPVFNIDFIFSNIIVNDAGWHLIDYEWVNFEKGNSKDALNRALNNYLLAGDFRKKIKEWVDFDESFNDDKFIKEKVLSKNKALSTVRHDIGKGVYDLKYLTDRIAAFDIEFQIYEDYGEGFREENSYFLSEFKKHGPNILLNIPMKDGLKNLRVDPGDKPLRFYVNHIYLGDEEITDKLIGINKNGCMDIRSCVQVNNTFTFKKADPHFKLPLKGLDFKEHDVLKIDCRAEYIC